MNKAKQKRSEVFFLKINKWKKYQIRKELKSMTYFRLQNDIFWDAKFASLTLTGKILWFYLLCEATRQYDGGNPDRSGGEVQLNMHLTMRQTGGNPRHIRSSILDLEQLQMVTVISNTNLCPIVEESRKEESRTTVSSKLKPTKNVDSSTQQVEKKSLTKEKKSTKISKQANQLELPEETKAKPIQLLMSQYYKTWSSKYGAKIARKPADGAIMKRLLKVNSFEHMTDMINAYFEMPDSWAVKKAHDLFTFERNFGEIVRFINTGQMVTRSKANEVDSDMEFKQKDAKREAEYRAAMREISEKAERRKRILIEGKVT